VVKITDIMEAIELSFASNIDPVITPYYDMVNQKVVFLEDTELESLTDDNRYISFYLDIYSSTIIESFILSINDSMIQNRMFDVFRGKGKYSRIKNYFYDLGIERNYYKFRDDYIKDLAIQWCQDHHVSYE